MNNFKMMWDFDVLDGINFAHCNRVHPLMQKNVARLIDSLKDDPNIVKIVIFGSALEFRCSSQSDLDVYLEKKDAQKPLLREPDVDCELDIVSNLPYESRLYHEIDEKGLIVWEAEHV